MQVATREVKKDGQFVEEVDLSNGTYGFDVSHVMDHADKIKRKAMWKLEQQLAEPLNKLFGTQGQNATIKGEIEPQAASMAVTLFAVFLLLVVFLVGFLLTCKFRKQRTPRFDGSEPQDLENELSKMRYKGLDDSESDDEETYAYQGDSGA